MMKSKMVKRVVSLYVKNRNIRNQSELEEYKNYFGDSNFPCIVSVQIAYVKPDGSFALRGLNSAHAGTTGLNWQSAMRKGRTIARIKGLYFYSDLFLYDTLQEYYMSLFD